MTAQVLIEKKKLEKPPLTIHTLGDRVLRQPAKRVKSVDAEIRQLVREMLQTMYSADGIGLAPPSRSQQTSNRTRLRPGKPRHAPNGFDQPYHQK